MSLFVSDLDEIDDMAQLLVSIRGGKREHVRRRLMGDCILKGLELSKYNDMMH